MNALTDWCLQLYRRLVQVPCLLVVARRDLRRGRVVEAKARFIRCTHLVPFSFHAHFGLACIYLKERDFSRAQRELLLAQEIAPARFRAFQARLPELVGVEEASGAGDFHGRDFLSSARDLARRDGTDPLEFEVFDGPEPSLRGDFSTHAEWLKFQRMGPITDVEIQTVDWDAVDWDAAVGNPADRDADGDKR